MLSSLAFFFTLTVTSVRPVHVVVCISSPFPFMAD